MKRIFRILPLLCAMIAVLMLTACGQNQDLKLGTGNTGGTYYQYGNALSNVLKNSNNPITVEVRSTAGSAGNLRLLGEGYLQLAIVQSDTLLDAVSGTGSFEGKKLSGFSAIAGLYTESCQILVRKDSTIQSVRDFVGKTISFGEEDSGVRQNAEQILTVSGIPLDQVKKEYLSFSDSVKALQEGKIDACFITAGTPTPAVSAVAQETEIRLLSLDEDTISRLTALYPCYVACEIPAGTYHGQTEAVKTIGVKAVLVASDSLSEKQTKEITAALFTNNSALQYAAGLEKALDVDTAIAGVPVGFHKGAAAYYSEQGKTVTIGGSQTTISNSAKSGQDD